MELASTLCICAMALLFQNASSVYIDPSYDCVPSWARTFLAWRKANTNVVGGFLSPLLRNTPRVRSTFCDDTPFPVGLAASPGGLAVASASNGPIGISILSENQIQGPLAVAGELPFLGTIPLGVALPTIGSGSVVYGTDGPNVDLLAAKARLLSYFFPIYYRPGSTYNDLARTATYDFNSQIK